MKIKGVYRANTKKNRRGDIIELSPQEKVPHAVGDGLRALAPKGTVYIVGRVQADAPLVYPKSTPLHQIVKKTFANNVYTAKGTVSYQKHTLSPDKIFPANTSKFMIEFEDVLDGIGQPDLKVKSFKLV
jgi:threonine dehydrogenase-like Zn-dependent dehydrogenase